jgi:N-acetylmuramoyl-L-alanine amidase
MSTDGGARYYCQFLPPLGSTPSVPSLDEPLQAEPSTPPLNRARASRNRVIMIDAGHGGSDPGASGVIPGTHEKNLVLSMCMMLQEELEQMGYTVLQTRTSDRFVSLGARTDYANEVLPYIFVSLHCNSFTDPAMEGLLTFIHPAASQDSRRLAALVESEAALASGAVEKGVREANFFVLRETVMPSILIEAGFLTHRDECGRLCDPKYQGSMMRGVAKGIDRFILDY